MHKIAGERKNLSLEEIKRRVLLIFFWIFDLEVVEIKDRVADSPIFLLCMFLLIYFPWKSTGGEWLFNGLAEINVSQGEKTSSLILAG